MVKYIKIAIIALAAFAVSCNRLELPDNFMELNRENSPFMEQVGKVDPKQTWNVAEDGMTLSGIELEVLEDVPTEGNSGDESPAENSIKAMSAQTKSTVTGKVMANFFSFSGKSFEVSVRDVNAGASDIEIGIYYYDENHNIVEESIYKKLSKVYNSAVKVTLKGGTMFGFYINSKIDKKWQKYYSEAYLNPDGYSHVVHQIEREGLILKRDVTYLYFEDSVGGDYDYDDVEIRVDEVIDVLDFDRGPWMLLCEDLGSVSDNDFNDVVLKVHRTSRTDINVEFVANGASLKNYAYKDGNMIGSEIHSMFGISDFNILINTTKKAGDVYPHPSLDLKVDPSFTMSATNMGGFMIQRGVFQSIEYDINQTGQAPFMLCVPGNFRWPIEGVSIFQAYPDFEKWAKDKNSNKTWYKNPVDTLVVTPKVW